MADKMTEADEYLANLGRHMLACQVECPLTVLWLASERQKQALNTLTYNYRAPKVRLWWQSSLPTGYLEGVLTAGGRSAAQIYFGISPEGEVHT